LVFEESFLDEMGIDRDGAIGHHAEVGLDDVGSHYESAIEVLETHLIMAHAHDEILIGNDTEKKKKEGNVMFGKNHGCVCLYLQTTIFFFSSPRQKKKGKEEKEKTRHEYRCNYDETSSYIKEDNPTCNLQSDVSYRQGWDTIPCADSSRTDSSKNLSKSWNKITKSHSETTY
jgi:hypothetical protein